MSISSRAIQLRIEAIIDFIYDEDTGEAMAEKLNNAWYELFGMHELLSAMTAQAIGNPQTQQEFETVQKMVAQAMATVEKLFEEITDDKNQFSSSGPQTGGD